MSAPATERRAAYERMGLTGGVIGFASDFATFTASQATTGFPVANLQSFADISLGASWRSNDTTAVTIDIDFGSTKTVNWCHLAGVRGVGLESHFASNTGVELLSGAASPATTSEGFFYLAPTTGDLWITIAPDVSARYWRIAFNGVTSGLGFYEVARVALGAYTVFPKAPVRGYTETATNNSSIKRTASQRKIPRFERPDRAANFRFPFVGQSTDLAAWRPFIGWGAELLEHHAPEIPFYFAPAPNGGATGPSEEWIAPRFCTMDRRPTPLRNMVDPAADLFDLVLQVETVPW